MSWLLSEEETRHLAEQGKLPVGAYLQLWSDHWDNDSYTGWYNRLYAKHVAYNPGYNDPWHYFGGGWHRRARMVTPAGIAGLGLRNKAAPVLQAIKPVEPSMQEPAPIKMVFSAAETARWTIPDNALYLQVGSGERCLLTPAGAELLGMKQVDLQYHDNAASPKTEGPLVMVRNTGDSRVPWDGPYRLVAVRDRRSYSHPYVVQSLLTLQKSEHVRARELTDDEVKRFRAIGQVLSWTKSKEAEAAKKALLQLPKAIGDAFAKYR